jgi:hypothetical protein
MSKNPDASNVSRRDFLAAAGTVAAAGSLAVGKNSALAQALPPPANTYHVAIDATQFPFSYTTDVPTPNTSAYQLYVTPGSTVAWIPKTAHSNKHCVAILFPNETPLVDANGRPLYAVLWSEMEDGTNQTLQTIDKNASGTYEYTVVVFDRESGKTSRDDPKIIVGSGMAIAKADLTSALAEIKKAKALLSGKPTVERQTAQIASIEHELAEVIEQLK